jgi:hypothetical protein
MLLIAVDHYQIPREAQAMAPAAAPAGTNGSLRFPGISTPDFPDCLALDVGSDITLHQSE